MLFRSTDVVPMARVQSGSKPHNASSARPSQSDLVRSALFVVLWQRILCRSPSVFVDAAADGGGVDVDVDKELCLECAGTCSAFRHLSLSLSYLSRWQFDAAALRWGVVWCGMVCGVVVWCGVWCGGVVWYGVVWCGVWCGVVWCGMRCCMMSCAVVCYGVGWCGVLDCGMLSCAVPCCPVLCCPVLCCAVLCCGVLRLALTVITSCDCAHVH